MQIGQNILSLFKISKPKYICIHMLSVVAAGTTLAFSSGVVNAEEDATTPETVLVIGESVSVSTDQLAGSYDVIGRDELDYEHPDDTYELFTKAPGVYISLFNQGIINNDVAIRGFAGDGITPHAKLLVDGIPFNINNGYGELDQLFPLDIETIELYKGASDARYGRFNTAGNFNVTSRRDVANDLKLTAGSFDAREIQSYNGFQSGNLNHRYFLGYREAGGYRDHTDIEKLELSGKWFYALGDGSELGLSVRHSTYDAESPGYLTEAEANANPTSSASYASEDGGDKEVNHYALYFDKKLSDTTSWLTKVYSNDFDRTRWVRFSEGGKLRERIDDQQLTGIITTFDTDLNDHWSLAFGADYENQDVIEKRFQHDDNVRGNTPDRVRRDHDYSLEILGAFFTVENMPSDFLRWNVGLRLDELDGDFTNVDTGTSSDINDY